MIIESYKIFDLRRFWSNYHVRIIKREEYHEGNQCIYSKCITVYVENNAEELIWGFKEKISAMLVPPTCTLGWKQTTNLILLEIFEIIHIRDAFRQI